MSSLLEEKAMVRKILNDWKLGQYYSTFIENEFYRIEDWDVIEENDLSELGVKKGSVRSFLKRVKNKDHLRYLNTNANEKRGGRYSILD